MESSLLSRLPPEIRDHVYQYVFTSRYAVTLAPRENQHALTKTCRQIRHETLAMYYALTRFNAHLDDGPATPLVEWLKTLGPELALVIDELNIWDMHMLNGILHGLDSTARILSTGIRTSYPDSTGSEESPAKYILRPIGNWVFNRGCYLKDIILALHSMGLGLSRFCIVDDDCIEGTRVKLTSDFAIVRLSSQPEGEIFKDEYTEINSIATQFGLAEEARESLILQLAAGERTITLQQRHRKLILQFDEKDGTRLTSMKQVFTSEGLEEVD